MCQGRRASGRAFQEATTNAKMYNHSSEYMKKKGTLPLTLQQCFGTSSLTPVVLVITGKIWPALIYSNSASLFPFEDVTWGCYLWKMEIHCDEEHCLRSWLWLLSSVMNVHNMLPRVSSRIPLKKEIILPANIPLVRKAYKPVGMRVGRIQDYKRWVIKFLPWDMERILAWPTGELGRLATSAKWWWWW